MVSVNNSFFQRPEVNLNKLCAGKIKKVEPSTQMTLEFFENIKKRMMKEPELKTWNFSIFKLHPIDQKNLIKIISERGFQVKDCGSNEAGMRASHDINISLNPPRQNPNPVEDGFTNESIVKLAQEKLSQIFSETLLEIEKTWAKRNNSHSISVSVSKWPEEVIQWVIETYKEIGSKVSYQPSTFERDNMGWSETPAHIIISQK